jgi:hypothetical protein
MDHRALETAYNECMNNHDDDYLKIKRILRYFKNVITDIVKRIINDGIKKFEITAEHYNGKIDNVTQDSITVVEFTLEVANTYFYNIGSIERCKIIKLDKHMLCDHCTIWYKPSNGCPICCFYSSDDDERDPDPEDDWHVNFYRKRGVVVSAHIKTSH